MKKIVIITFLILVSLCAYSQKIIVGVLERAPTNNNRQDYYYTISIGSGSERELKQAMENKLKQNPQYNWMKDFQYAYVGHEGEYYVTIIEFNNKYGVGIGINKSESLNEAIERIKSIFYLNSISDYKTILSKDFSYKFNLPKIQQINNWDGPHIGEYGYHYYYKGNKEVVIVKSSGRSDMPVKWRVQVGEKDSGAHRNINGITWYDFDEAKRIAEEYMRTH